MATRDLSSAPRTKSIDEKHRNFIQTVQQLERQVIVARQRIRKAKLSIGKLGAKLSSEIPLRQQASVSAIFQTNEYLKDSVTKLLRLVKEHHRSLKRLSENVDRSRSLIKHPAARAAYSKTCQVQRENEHRIRKLRSMLSKLSKDLQQHSQHVTRRAKKRQAPKQQKRQEKEPTFIFDLQNYETLVQKALTGRKCDPEYVLRLMEDPILCEDSVSTGQEDLSMFSPSEHVGSPQQQEQKTPRRPEQTQHNSKSDHLAKTTSVHNTHSKISPRPRLLPGLSRVSRTDRLARRARARLEKTQHEKAAKEQKQRDKVRNRQKKKRGNENEAANVAFMKAFHVQKRMETLHSEFVQEWEEQLEWNLKHQKKRSLHDNALPKPTQFHETIPEPAITLPKSGRFGILRVQVVEFEDLVDVQGVGQLRPYAKITLLPSSRTLQTKPLDSDHAKLVLEPVKHLSILDFPIWEKGMSGISPFIRVEVFDSGVFKHDVPIGQVDIQLLDIVDTPERVVNINHVLGAHPDATCDSPRNEKGKVKLNLLFLDTMHSKIADLPRHRIKPEHLSASAVEGVSRSALRDSGNRLSRLAMNKVGVLRVRIATAINLNLRNCEQPHLALSLHPWNEVKYDHHYLKSYLSQTGQLHLPPPTMHDLKYLGLPPEGTVPLLQVKVLGRRVSKEEKHAGDHSDSQDVMVLASGVHNLSWCLEKPRVAQEVQMILMDESRKSVGVLIVHVAFSPDGPLPESHIQRMPPYRLFPEGYYPPSRVLDIATQQFWAQDSIISNNLMVQQGLISSQMQQSATVGSSFQLAPELMRLKGLIHIQPLHANNLKQVQWIGTQDPYVKVILMPWEREYMTKEHNDGGKSPKWDETKHQSNLSLDYNGESITQGQVPFLKIQVFDKEFTKADRIIGEASIGLQSVFNASSQNCAPLTLTLADKSGKPAGTLVLKAWFAEGGSAETGMNPGTEKGAIDDENILHQTGTVRVQALLANNLKNVQWVGKQDPYVRVHLSRESNFVQTKDHMDGGRSPVWDPAKHDSIMLLSYNGVEEAKYNQGSPVINVQVMDKEVAKADRLIGKGSVDLAPYLRVPGREDAKVTVNLVDENQKPAGVLRLCVTFIAALGTAGAEGGGVAVNYRGNLQLFRCEALNIRSQRYTKPLYMKLTAQPQGTVFCTRAIACESRARNWLSPDAPRLVDEKQCTIKLPFCEGAKEQPSTLLLVQLYAQRSDKDDKLLGESQVTFDRSEVDRSTGKLSIDMILFEQGNSGRSGSRIAGQVGMLNLEFALEGSQAANEAVKLNSEAPDAIVAKNKDKVRKLFIQPLSATGLVSVQRIGDQDPYVIATLDPLGKSGKTLEHSNGGRSPIWEIKKHKSLIAIDLEDSEASREDLKVKFQVMDAEILMADRLVGFGEFLDVASVMENHDVEKKKKISVNLCTKKGHSSGTLDVLIWYFNPFKKTELESEQLGNLALSSEEAALRIQKLHRKRLRKKEPIVEQQHYSFALTVRPIRGSNLRNVHRIGKQDPYVSVSLEPLGITRVTKPHRNGGREPSWSESEHASVLEFQVDKQHKKSVEDLQLRFLVLDHEHFRQDRFIARGTFALEHLARDPEWEAESWACTSARHWPIFSVFQRNQQVTLPLSGPNEEPAGALEVQLDVRYPEEALRTEQDRRLRMLASPSWKPAEAESSASWFGDAELAATRIQAIRRGQLGRARAKKYLGRKQSLMNLDGRAMSALERAIQRNEEEAAAAVRIQRMYKQGYRTRVDAARHIQAHLRGRRTRLSIANNRGKGKLHLTVLQAFNLKRARRFGARAPYLRATLMPWCESQRTRPQKHDPANPVFDRELHDAHMEFDYPNHPVGVLDYWKRPVKPEPWPAGSSPRSKQRAAQEQDHKVPSLLLEVLDSRLGGADRLVGRAVFSLLSALQTCGEQVAHQVTVVDPKGRPAGAVVVNVRYAPEEPLGAALQLKDQETLLAQLQDQQERAWQKLQRAEEEEEAARVLQRQFQSHKAQQDARQKLHLAERLRSDAESNRNAAVAIQARLRGGHARQEYERLRENAERLRKLAHKQETTAVETAHRGMRPFAKPGKEEMDAKIGRAKHLRMCAEAEENLALAVREEIDRTGGYESPTLPHSPVARHRVQNSEIQHDPQVDTWRFKVHSCSLSPSIGVSPESFATVAVTLHPERSTKHTTSSSRNGLNPQWDPNDPRNILEYHIPHVLDQTSNSFVEFQVFISDSKRGSWMAGRSNMVLQKAKPLSNKVYSSTLEVSSSQTSNKVVGHLVIEYQFDELGLFGNLLMPKDLNTFAASVPQNLSYQNAPSSPYKCYEAREERGYGVSNTPAETPWMSQPTSPAAMMSGAPITSIDIDDELHALEERRLRNPRHQYRFQESDAAIKLQSLFRGNYARDQYRGRMLFNNS